MASDRQFHVSGYRHTQRTVGVWLGQCGAWVEEERLGEVVVEKLERSLSVHGVRV
jgi:hypothetical protein